MLIRRVPLPAPSEEGVQSWLNSLWSEKERALARWEHDGSFEAERIDDLPLPCRPLLGALVAYALWAALTASSAVIGGLRIYHLITD